MVRGPVVTVWPRSPNQRAGHSHPQRCNLSNFQCFSYKPIVARRGCVRTVNRCPSPHSRAVDLRLVPRPRSSSLSMAGGPRALCRRLLIVTVLLYVDKEQERASLKQGSKVVPVKTETQRSARVLGR